MTTPEMVWIDYEGTGVHEEGPVLPLEIGIILTDKAGNEIDSFESLVVPRGWEFAMQQAKPLVKEMHAKSGLVDRLVAASAYHGPKVHDVVGPAAVQQRIMIWLDQRFGSTTALNKMPMTGSSVHYDRRVAQEHMPALHKWFHYRNLDVSSIKNACQLLNPDLYKRLPKDPNKAHRPLADIRASIREFQWYQNEFLIVEGDRRSW